MRILVVSDLHYAAAAERQRGPYEYRAVPHPGLRLLLRCYRRFIWLRDPFAHNHQLDRFLAQAGSADLVVANGDYSCDSAFVGVSDEAACESARCCLDRLRGAFGARFTATLGDHELGKFSLFGAQGGLRLASWIRATGELALEPFWRRDQGDWVMAGLTSSLIAWPVLEPESLPGERTAWRELRDRHLESVRRFFGELRPHQRVVLFLHDPTALPYLGEEPAVRRKAGQIAVTVIGHLHSELILRSTQWLGGVPAVRFLGNGVRRMSQGLSRARAWRPFHVRLCPALAGIELLKDGGYLEIQLPADARQPVRIHRHRLPWGDRIPDAARA